MMSVAQEGAGTFEAKYVWFLKHLGFSSTGFLFLHMMRLSRKYFFCFPNVSWQSKHIKLLHFPNCLLCSFKNSVFLFYLLTWPFCKFECPVKLIGAAKFLTKSAAINSRKVPKYDMSTLLGFRIHSIAVFDYCGLDSWLSKILNSISRWIRAGVAIVRHRYGTGHAKDIASITNTLARLI